MSNRCADLTFGINSQALAILQLLAGQDPTFADWDGVGYGVEIQTFPWYNGREKGVCLVMKPRSYKQKDLLHIAFGENRGTDGIFVETWEAEEPFNCPTLENRDDKVGDEACKNRMSFPYGQIGRAAERIVGYMAEFYIKAKKAQA